jgi:hypothetical protein
MVYVMRQMGTAYGQKLPGDGQFLADFDFEADDGVGEICLTPDPASAKHFADLEELQAFYRTSPACRPLRPDGKPNRPLTAANWAIEKLPD